MLTNKFDGLLKYLIMKQAFKECVKLDIQKDQTNGQENSLWQVCTD